MTILGATGYTGRLCAHEAARRGLDVCLAGRDEARLAALAAELDGTGEVDTVVVDARAPEELARLAAGSRVLLTTVGPYLEIGGPIVDAAVDAGCAYLDITGEVPFAAAMAGRAARAEASGSVLCSAAGFDGAAGELLTAAAAAGGDGPVESVRVAYRLGGTGASAGTLRSALGVVAHGGHVVRGGRLVPEAIGGRRWDAPFRSGVRRAVSVPLPELVHVPRSLAASDVGTYAALVPVPGLSAAARLGGLALRTPLRRVVAAAADRFGGKAGDPDRARTSTEVVAELVRGGTTVRAWASVADLYGATATIAVACAARLADPSTRPAAGITTPVLLLGDPAATLDEIAESWGVGP